jgi:ubiquinone/menaquinone biosynthesis C-methylase UbiE
MDESNKIAYMLKTGQVGKARLELLEKICGDQTELLFNKIGLKKDMNFANIGCGIGSGMQSIYSKIGPNGKILCLDISKEQMEVAKEQLRHIESVSYKVENIERDDFEALNQDECGKYDVVYCRFVLIHLSNPMQALNNMLKLLKPNGVIACEELFENQLVLQEDDALKLFRSLASKMPEKIKCDFQFGKKLIPIFKQLGLTEIDHTGYLKFKNSKEEKKFFLWTFLEAKDKMIEHGILNEKDVEEVINKFNRYINDESTFNFSGMVLQIWARKL